MDGRADNSSFTVDGAQNLPYSTKGGYQVLLPGMKFNCYGNLTSWSALTVFNNDGVIKNALGQMTFQVWRPTGSGRYKLIGFDNIIVLIEDLLPFPGTEHEDKRLAYHYLLNATEPRDSNSDYEKNKPLYFKPDDIIGLNIRSFRITVNKQLYMTYRSPTASDPDHLVMDMYFNSTDGGNSPCGINTCSDGMEKIESVIPNIFFTYGTYILV